MLRRALIGFPRALFVRSLDFCTVPYSTMSLNRSPPVSFTICRRTHLGDASLCVIFHDSRTAWRVSACRTTQTKNSTTYLMERRK